jgi:hypothetical protein
VLLLVVIGEPVPTGLMEIAREAIGRGFDAPALHSLAAHVGDDGEARAMVLRVAEEVGWDLPDAQAARVELVRHWASGLLTGQVAPIDGARSIARIGAELDGVEGEPGVFATLVTEWTRFDDGSRQECERRIVEEAGLLVADTA